jgi:hypothetical protein
MTKNFCDVCTAPAEEIKNSNEKYVSEDTNRALWGSRSRSHWQITLAVSLSFTNAYDDTRPGQSVHLCKKCFADMLRDLANRNCPPAPV